MCGLIKINQDIERCQNQIATIYGLPKSEQCAITLQGFQLQLKKLLHEKAKSLHVIGAEVFQPHTSRFRDTRGNSIRTFRELAQKVIHCTIAEAKQLE